MLLVQAVSFFGFRPPIFFWGWESFLPLVFFLSFGIAYPCFLIKFFIDKTMGNEKVSKLYKKKIEDNRDVENPSQRETNKMCNCRQLF